MKRHTTRLAAVAVAVIAAGGLSIGIAQAVTPPAGTPDLSSMALAASDLGPGATALTGAYVKPAGTVIAEYERGFGAVTTTAGVKLAALFSGVLLLDSTADAAKSFNGIRKIYSSKLGRALLAGEVVKGAGKASGVTVKDVHFGRSASVGVGDESLILSVLVEVKHRGAAADFVVVRIGSVLALIDVIVKRTHLDSSVATGLAGTVGAHITAVLAASGASGPTGPTGPTGATG
jgi:hypothetical protein